jgi:hypothetical protein
MDSQHPIIWPPDVGHEPHDAVRDPGKLASTEDLDREPDGVPHGVVGLTALFSVMLAMLVAATLLSGHIVGKIATIALIVLAIPALVTGLRGKAERERCPCGRRA